MKHIYVQLLLNLRLKLFQICRRLGLRPKRIYYIGSNEVLPPPLNADEERELLDLLGTGDKNVKTTLIERNLRLVVYIARKFESSGVGMEDLISIGSIGLIKAVNTFDPGRNVKLATYASKCIDNEIRMFLRRNNKTRLEVSLEEPLHTDYDGNEIGWIDILGVESNVTKGIEEEVDRALLISALKRLNPRETKIMKLRFGLEDGIEKTQKEVADCLGISQSYISRLEKRILKKLRREIKKMQ
ncbi:MAG: RNA polymerase sporulation sigma factor SigE [Firmicutes bacterium]|nr:RNA polymerase sporulation sigma factor SigE [Bacillota bacterium]